MDGFDADVLVDAATVDHPLGRRVRPLLAALGNGVVGVGSVLLVPELMSTPLRSNSSDELEAFSSILGRLDLRPVDLSTAELAASLGASYRLRAADAVHLATSIAAGADRFLTNRKDFPRTITEVDVTYPSDLPDVQV